MARQAPKLTLSPSRDIPLDRLTLSQSNVRRVKAGVSIETLADDIARRGLLQSLNVRPILDGEGQETGRYEIPAGGRRFRALELLVKRKRLASNASVPCVVRAANDEILAEDDSLAENAMREALHPLDQFRAMQAMVDKGEDVEAIAANFYVTPAVVRQRLKLASVSPRLHEAYADDRISLEQLMAFTILEDEYSAHDNLVNILKKGRIWGSDQKGYIRGGNEAACFMDVPFASLKYVLTPENMGKVKLRYQAYGVVIGKDSAYKRGLRPVLYLSKEEIKTLEIPRREQWRVVLLERSDKGWVNWAHEREWRCQGDFKLKRTVPAVIVRNLKAAKRLREQIADVHDDFKCIPDAILPASMICQGLLK